jgi:hypothetical protein
MITGHFAYNKHCSESLIAKGLDSFFGPSFTFGMVIYPWKRTSFDKTPWLNAPFSLTQGEWLEKT